MTSRGCWTKDRAIQSTPRPMANLTSRRSFSVSAESGSTASGTLTNDATVAAGQSACQTDGGSGTLLKGDLIKFSNHDKVYMVTADRTISGTNDAINFYPPLVTGITNSTTVTYDNVPVKVYMDKDEVKFITQTDGAFKYEIVLNEEI